MLPNNSQLGRHKAYLDQIAPLNVKVPGEFPNAKSVVVVAAYSKNMYSNFWLDGNSYRVLIPFRYCSDDWNTDKIKGIIQKDVLKNPGALAEPQFLAVCMRCGECIKVYPTNALQPASDQAGPEGLVTPDLIPKIGYCEYYCSLCTLVCPTGAL
jgi:ferredoxin